MGRNLHIMGFKSTTRPDGFTQKVKKEVKKRDKNKFFLKVIDNGINKAYNGKVAKGERSFLR